MKLVTRWPRGAYLLAGDVWVGLNIDPKCRTEPMPDHTHVAFNVARDDYPRLRARLESAGVTSFQDNRSPGESVYFLDPDGHKLELHYGTLEDRL